MMTSAHSPSDVRRRRCGSYAFPLAVLLLAIVPHVVDATSSVPPELIQAGGFNCAKVWKTASSANQITQCFDVNHLLNDYIANSPLRMAPLVFAVLSIVTAVLTFLIYPFFMIGRYCCKLCGSNKRRPGVTCCGGSEWDDRTDLEKEAAYSVTDVKCAKVSSFVILLLSVSALIVTLTGTSSLQIAYNSAFDNGIGIIAWGNQKLADIRSNMTFEGDLIEPLTPSLFIDMEAKTGDFQKQILDFKSLSSQYVELGNIVALCIAIGPMVFIVVTVLCAVFDLRSVVLLINSVFHFLFILPFGVLGGLFVILGIVLADVSAERQMFLENRPGLFSLWFVPYFEEQVPFARIRDDVQIAEVSNSKEGCRNLLTICAPQSTWSSATPDVIYTCLNLNNADADCPGLSQLTSYFNGVTLMTSSPTFCSNLTDQTGCKIPVCADVCNKESVRNSSAKAYRNLRKAQKAKGSFETSVKPLLNFTTVTTELLDRLSVLNDMRDGFLIGGIGLSLFCFFFVADLIVIFRGQKRFFKPPRVPEEGGEEKPGSPGTNEPTV